MYCIYCDAETPDTILYCTSCGRQFSQVVQTPLITCSSCRAENPNDAVFCWNCGKRLERDKAAGVIVPGIALGGAIGGAAAKVLLSQASPAASHVEPGLAHPGIPVDAGHGLSHPAPNVGQGTGHVPGTIPAHAPSSLSPSSTAASAPPAAPAPASPAPAPQPAMNPPQVATQTPQPSSVQTVSHPSAAPQAPAHPQPAHPAAPQVPHTTQPVQALPHTPAPQHLPTPTHPLETPSHEAAPQHVRTPSQPLEHPHHPEHLLHHPTHLHHPVTGKVLKGGLKLTTHLSRRALLIAIAGGTATVVVGGTLVYKAVSQSQSTPEKTLSTYLDAIKSGDAQTAYNQLSSRMQSQVSEQQLASLLSTDGAAFSGINYSISNVQVTGSTATATVSLSVLGISETASVQFVMENGTWKIDGGTILNFQPSGG